MFKGQTVYPFYKYSQIHNTKTICLVQKKLPIGEYQYISFFVFEEIDR